MKGEANERTIKEVRAELERDTRVNLHESTIAITTTRGSTRLDGEVPDLAAKRIAVNLCRQLAGADASVEDHLCVATPPRQDGDLATRIGERLAGELAFANAAIERQSDGTRDLLQRPSGAEQVVLIDVSDGIVTLRGAVLSLSHRRLAEVLCWWVAGCRRVDNELTVVPAQDDGDDVLNDAVRLALEADPLVDAAGLRTGAAAGIVEIEGVLGSEEAHRLALRDVWAVPGVWDVYDRIEIVRGAS